MKFNEWVTMYEARKRKCKKGLLKFKGYGDEIPHPCEYYVNVVETMNKKYDARFNCDAAQPTMENRWMAHSSPYYNVYPSIYDMLTRLDLGNICFACLENPVRNTPILARFPETRPFLGKIKSMLFYQQSNETHSGVHILVDLGNKDRFGAVDSCFYLLAGEFGNCVMESVDHTAEKLDEQTWNYDEHKKITKMICTLCLLGDSPELIQPEVLKADEHKLTGQHAIEALVAKARRRGKYGFTVGKDIEVMPHYRRPHLALVWYGPGKKKSKIIPRKGSIVHRSKVEKIPTGYAASEAGE